MLNDGWNNYHIEVSIKEYNNINSVLSKENTEEEPLENFYDNPKRVEDFYKWLEDRKVWATKQKIYDDTRSFLQNYIKFCGFRTRVRNFRKTYSFM